jgi:hypothetical protein
MTTAAPLYGANSNLNDQRGAFFFFFPLGGGGPRMQLIHLRLVMRYKVLDF